MLTEALAALDAAKKALADFLVTADGDDDAETSTDGTALKAKYDAAVEVTDAEVDGDYANGSPAVKAALLVAQQTANSEALAAEQAKVATANANIAKVAGLTAAVAASKAADEKVKTTTEAAAAAQVAEEAAIASWKVIADGQAKTDGATATAGVLTVTIDDASATPLFADNLVLTLTEVNATTGVVSLVKPDTAWTAAQVSFFQAQQALAADVIAKFNASVTADNAKGAAETAAEAALLQASLLDSSTDADVVAALAAVGAGFTKTTVANAAKPTAAEIKAEIAALTKVENDGKSALSSQLALVKWTTDATTTKDAADNLIDAAATDGFIDATSATAIKAAFAPASAADVANSIKAAITALSSATNDDGALDVFNALVDAYYDKELGKNPLLDALETAKTAAEGVQSTIDALAELVTAEQAAKALFDKFGTLDKAVTDAETVLADANFVVSSITAIQAGTADNDAYLLNSIDGTITAFGDAGVDSIFLGKDYTFNAGDAAKDGNNAALEFFLSEDIGGNTTVTVETSAFGSSAATPEVVKIILTGVSISELTFADGLLSAGTAA